MTRAIITTTINPPQNVDAWERQLSPGDMIIVAGDLKTPHEPWEEWENEQEKVLRRYLSPADQENWQVSSIIGWNSIQRRNIALLYALCQKPDFITTIDDDNWPVEDEFFKEIPQPRARFYTDDGWWDPGSLCVPQVRHRGMPFGVYPDYEDERVKFEEESVIGVWAHLWLDDPDIDAMERIVKNPQVAMVNTASALAADTWAPFNSQSTTYDAKIASIMPVLPFVGRMDDIWASYIARSVMDTTPWRVYYGPPLVRQTRNEHDLFKDLQGEMIGYEHTLAFTEFLRKQSKWLAGWTERPDIIGRYFYMARRIFESDELPYFPRKTSRFMLAWCKDVRSALRLWQP